VRDICKKEAERQDLSSCENYITQRRGY
nr:RecName: Full=Trypsin inhibitor 1; Short=JcTI-I [Jatropha curcas]